MFVLRGAFWALDLVALQAFTAPVARDWYTPVLEGVAVPIYALAALVMVTTLIAETVAGMVTGNTPRVVQAIFRALVAGMLASAAGSLLLAIAGALSNLGQIALTASGTTVDAPLVPLQEVLMDSALQRDTGAELFVVFLAGFLIVFSALAIYFTLAMRPVLLAALIVFLPVAHALSVWTPMRRVQMRAWSLAFAVLLADAAILTMFAVTNSVMGQPAGVDRLIFGTFGVLLAALAPAALARIVGTPELQTAVQAMSRGSKAAAVGAGVVAVKGALVANRVEQGARRGGGQSAGGAVPGAGGAVPGAGGGPSGRPGSPAGGSSGSPLAGGGGSSGTGGSSASPSGSSPSGSAASDGTRHSSATATGGSGQAAAPSPSGGTGASSGPGRGSSGSGWQGALTRPAAGARP